MWMTYKMSSTTHNTDPGNYGNKLLNAHLITYYWKGKLLDTHLRENY